jgi:ribosomal protein S18 acetylase RimI-like enzyme
MEARRLSGACTGPAHGAPAPRAPARAAPRRAPPRPSRCSAAPANVAEASSSAVDYAPRAAAPAARPALAALAPAAAAVRPAAADGADDWEVAEAHCAAFYPGARAPLWGPLLRLDRVVSLRMGRERGAGRGRGAAAAAGGEFACLVADAGGSRGGAAAPAPLGVDLGPLVGPAARWLLPAAALEGAARAGAAPLAGAVVIDQFLDFVPPRAARAGGGRRASLAYLSNLAVAPDQRRRGLGLRLVRAAEAAAAAWGCRAVALHVCPSNAAAVALYTAAGYRAVEAGRQPAWQARLEGRAAPLVLMLRRLPRGEAP